MGQENYDNAKQVAQDIIYKVEELGKELDWDAVTKHEKFAGKVREYSAYNIVTCS